VLLSLCDMLSYQELSVWVLWLEHKDHHPAVCHHDVAPKCFSLNSFSFLVAVTGLENCK
jgi:hypothetical protein